MVDERYKYSDVPIKLAMIDCGTDSKHPLLKDLFQRGQIVCKSFVDGIPHDEDVCGHGTHVAHLILKVAPRVRIYSARAFTSGQTGELEKNKASIAKACESCRSQLTPLTYLVTGNHLCDRNMERRHNLDVLGIPQRDSGNKNGPTRSLPWGRHTVCRSFKVW